MGCELGMDLSRLNVNGGAIALGHPLAATGVRLTITLAREMVRSNVRYGIRPACVGGGQGIALLIRNPLAPDISIKMASTSLDIAQQLLNWA